jgi:hypothetical protein
MIEQTECKNLTNNTYITTNKILATYLRYKGYDYALSDTGYKKYDKYNVIEFIFIGVPDMIIRDYFHNTPEVILYRNIISIRDLVNRSINTFMSKDNPENNS